MQNQKNTINRTCFCKYCILNTCFSCSLKSILGIVDALRINTGFFFHKAQCNIGCNCLHMFDAQLPTHRAQLISKTALAHPVWQILRAKFAPPFSLARMKSSATSMATGHYHNPVWILNMHNIRRQCQISLITCSASMICHVFMVGKISAPSILAISPLQVLVSTPI